MNRTNYFMTWLLTAFFAAIATFGGTQVYEHRAVSELATNGGVVAGASAKSSTHLTDRQHWENRRCSDHLPEKGGIEILPAEQRGAHCWTEWTEDVVNTNATAGLALLLNCMWAGTSYCGSAWYVGIVGATSTFASTDTMASHSGFVECTACFTAPRPGLSITSAVAGSSSVSNAASVAGFAITATTTVSGAFLTTGSSVAGTAGTLWGGASFTVARAVISGDTLNVTVTLTAS